MSIFQRLGIGGPIPQPVRPSPFMVDGGPLRAPPSTAPVAAVPVPPSAVAPVRPTADIPLDLAAPPPQPIDRMELGQNLGMLAAAPQVQQERNSVFDRIGDFIRSDEGRGALLRSGAATLQNGLGAGVAAGASWVDQRRQQRIAQANEDRNFGLRQQAVQIDQQQADTQAMNVASQIQDRAVQQGIDVAKLEEARRKAMAGEALDQAELRLLAWYRQQQISLGYVEEAGRNSRAADDNAVQLYQHNTPSASTVYTQESTNERYYNPVPQPGYTTRSVTTPGEDGESTTVTSRVPAPGQNANEGRQVIGPDGRNYVIRNGQPVPVGSLLTRPQ